MQLYIPYRRNLELPTHMPCGVPITFGVELEGVIAQPTSIQASYFDLFSQTSYIADQLSAELNKNGSTWIVKSESGLQPKNTEVGLEAVSGILSGSTGIWEIDRKFERLESLGFEPTISSGLHVHTSLGWKKKAADLSGRKLKYAKNVAFAYGQNDDFFMQLVKSYRHDNGACYKNPQMSVSEWRHTTTSKQLIDHYRCWGKGVRCNMVALEKHGTIEWRMKEAEAYRQSLGFIQFTILFTVEAALNPHIRAEQVLDKYGMEAISANQKTDHDALRPTAAAPSRATSLPAVLQ